MKQIILKRVYHDEMNHPNSINNIKYQIKNKIQNIRKLKGAFLINLIGFHYLEKSSVIIPSHFILGGLNYYVLTFKLFDAIPLLCTYMFLLCTYVF